jgi:hypothetical protein
MKMQLTILATVVAFSLGVATASEVTGLTSFTSGTPAKASEVNDNFSAVKTAVDDNAADVATNTAGIATNAADVATIATGVMINTTGIATNASAIVNSFAGDGSAGDLTVSTGTDWGATPPVNPFFRDIVIDVAQTLTVPAGTTIYCRSFTNNGTLLVNNGPEIGSVTSISTTTSPTSGENSSSHPGDSLAPASIGDVNNISNNSSGAFIPGGNGGKPIPQAVATTAFGKFKFGGGSAAGYDNQGGHGGGLVRIQCLNAIVNNGTINARGTSATNTSIGGGGGGIVILTSLTSVDNSVGTIDVSGGNGADARFFGGNGGGGGGGIIILASPSAPVSGVRTVTGGTGGTGNTTLTANTRRSGSGGGASGGAGGNGGQVSSTGIPAAGNNGGDGYVISLTLNPIALAR